jgi:hypothetical protein
MPFASPFDGIWQTVIRPTVHDSGDTCFRADDIFAPGPIINDIVRAIHDADYIIADLTEKNPNVYYELGLAHASGKPVILITQNIANLPFDLRHQRIIEYADTAAGAVRLRTILTQYLSSI